MIYHLSLKLKRFINKLAVSAYLGRYNYTSPIYSMEKLGTVHGGWYLPADLVKPEWICYSAGAGEDISFDVELNRKFGCRVWIFDPTPRAIKYVKSRIRGTSGIQFMPVGLWSSEATLKFYQPRDPSHISHSVVNIQNTEKYFEAPCLPLTEIMSTLGHHRIDLLKIDIEGAEHEVIRHMLARNIRPTVLCLEIDQPVSAVACIRTLSGIRRAGYALCAIERWNFCFVYRPFGQFAGSDQATGESPVSPTGTDKHGKHKNYIKQIVNKLPRITPAVSKHLNRGISRANIMYNNSLKNLNPRYTGKPRSS